MSDPVGWLDCGGGVSGDMLLGALVGAGVPLTVLQDAVDAVAPEPVELWAQPVRRAGLAATRVHVDAPPSTTHRTFADVRALLAAAGLAPAVAGRAGEVFARLAGAEARVHGVPAEQIHFHEVGALDAIADVVAACAGFAHLRLGGLTVSPVAVGGGSVPAAHGRLPVPPPAVVELLAAAGVPTAPANLPAGVEAELATPTGVALATTLATGFGPLPPMRITATGTGAGGRELPDRPNVVRLLVGTPATGDGTRSRQVVLASNVDDLDPRLWPGVLEALLAAGAADAWLTPILMKKGRPGHTVSALVDPARVDAVTAAVFAHTSAIGLRITDVGKLALARDVVTVAVAGQPVRVKVARDAAGATVNVQPEFDDVAAAAGALDRPVKAVLAAATAAALTATRG